MTSHQRVVVPLVFPLPASVPHIPAFVGMSPVRSSGSAPAAWSRSLSFLWLAGGQARRRNDVQHRRTRGRLSPTLPRVPTPRTRSGRPLQQQISHSNCTHLSIFCSDAHNAVLTTHRQCSREPYIFNYSESPSRPIHSICQNPDRLNFYFERT